jgi:hypothetical protein
MMRSESRTEDTSELATMTAALANRMASVARHCRNSACKVGR